jgi:anti-sigma factor RsiW
MNNRDRCRDVDELLVPYLHGEVSASERAFVQAHLARCTKCRERLARLSDLHSRLSLSLRSRAATSAPPDHAWEHLQARLAQQPQTPHRRRHNGRGLLATLGAFVVSLVDQLGATLGMARRGVAVTMLLVCVMAAVTSTVSGMLNPVLNQQLSATVTPRQTALNVLIQHAGSAVTTRRERFGPVPDPQTGSMLVAGQASVWLDFVEPTKPRASIGPGQWMSE